jgi:16S rRNA (cytidine1402-2'-O)-methyltransferase
MEIQKQSLKPGLYLVATPIGNLRDMTLRALDTLASVDVIYCEDTRVSGKLLKHYGIKSSLKSYNDHSADDKRDEIIARIQDGESIALISDAGMPLISDPGYKLVRDCRDAALFVTSLPGANAPLSALQLSGLPTDRFTFIGFLPAKTPARDKALKAWGSVKTTLMMFESPRRVRKTLESMNRLWPNRKIAVVREITKLYEEVKKGTALTLLNHYEEKGMPKGEIVLVVEGPGEEQAYTAADIEAALLAALKTMKTKDAVRAVAAQTGWAKKALYVRALELQDE